MITQLFIIGTSLMLAAGVFADTNKVSTIHPAIEGPSSISVPICTDLDWGVVIGASYYGIRQESIPTGIRPDWTIDSKIRTSIFFCSKSLLAVPIPAAWLLVVATACIGGVVTGLWCRRRSGERKS